MISQNNTLYNCLTKLKYSNQYVYVETTQLAYFKATESEKKDFKEYLESINDIDSLQLVNCTLNHKLVALFSERGVRKISIFLCKLPEQNKDMLMVQLAKIEDLNLTLSGQLIYEICMHRKFLKNFNSKLRLNSDHASFENLAKLFAFSKLTALHMTATQNGRMSRALEHAILRNDSLKHVEIPDLTRNYQVKVMQVSLVTKIEIQKSNIIKRFFPSLCLKSKQMEIKFKFPSIVDDKSEHARILEKMFSTFVERNEGNLECRSGFGDLFFKRIN